MFIRNPKETLDSLVGVAARISGDMRFTGGLRIDGQVRGNVIAEAGQHSYLVLGEHGKIDGEVRCGHMVVSGEINGPVYSSELLEIQPRARIVGDVYYKVLEMHGGALISGQLTHQCAADNVLHLAASEA